MYLRALITVCTGIFLGSGLASTGAAQEAQRTTTRVELILVERGGQLTALSLSTGQGAYVETQSFASDGGVATGVIASPEPLSSSSDENGFGLFTSDVGDLLVGGGGAVAQSP